jgi:hypothetical protein
MRVFLLPMATLVWLITTLIIWGDKTSLEHTGIAAQATIEANKYAVYSAVLNGMYLNNRFKDRSVTIGDAPVVMLKGRYVDNSVKLLVIRNETTRCSPLPGGEKSAELVRLWEEEEEVAKRIPELNSDTLNDFRAKKKACHPLGKRFNVPVKYVLVSKEDLESVFPKERPPLDLGWSLFYQTYPGSSGDIGFSNVGFNRALTQAFVYTGRWCGVRCGEGYYVLLTKKDGVWSITTELMVWIS